MLKIINQSEATSKYQLPDSTEKEFSAKSNEATILYMTDAFKKVRSTAKTFGEPDEEIEQTLVLTNQTEYDITDVTIQETIGVGVTFKEGSVTVDNTPYVDFNVANGYLLPNGVPANSTVTIKYMVKIATAITTQTSDLDTLITYTINEADNLKEHANKITINLSANMLTIKKESDKSAVIGLSSNDSFLISCLNEVRARGGKVFFLKNKYPGGLLGALSLSRYVQLIAYYTAKELGNDPDHPRNLAKSVTVI